MEVSGLAHNMQARLNQLATVCIQAKLFAAFNVGT